MINIVSTDSYIAINYIEGYQLAVAEASLMNTGEWYFNRLSVPISMRNKGIATLLMTNFQNEIDKKKAVVVCDVNPYGDLNRKQLNTFYKKFGFVKHKFYDLIRYPIF